MLKKIFIIISLHLSLILSVNANIEIKARTAILQDFLSGEILYEKDPDRSIYPASMTKIMTSIIAFDLIKSGDLSLDDKFIISEKAWSLKLDKLIYLDPLHIKFLQIRNLVILLF